MALTIELYYRPFPDDAETGGTLYVYDKDARLLREAPFGKTEWVAARQLIFDNLGLEVKDKKRSEHENLCFNEKMQALAVPPSYVWAERHGKKKTFKNNKETRARLIVRIAPWNKKELGSQKVYPVRDIILLAKQGDAFKGYLLGVTPKTPHDPYYVDLICAKGAGKALMQVFMHHFGNVALSSVVENIGFYKRLGFEFGPACGEEYPFEGVDDLPPTEVPHERNKISPLQWRLIRHSIRHKLGPYDELDDPDVPCTRITAKYHAERDAHAREHWLREYEDNTCYTSMAMTRCRKPRKSRTRVCR